MTKLAEFFRRTGTVQPATANRPFLLNDANRVCLVISGSVNVFSVAVKDGDVLGPRRFVAGFNAGQILFDLAGDTDADGIAMLAVAGHDTALALLDAPRLRAAGADSDIAMALAQAIDDWIAALSAALVPEVAPKKSAVPEPGVERTLAPNATTRAARGVVWVRQLDGRATFLSSDKHSIDSATGWIPVSSKTWVKATGKGRQAAASTADLMADGSLWESIDRFHEIAKTCMERAETNRVLVERDRIRQKRESDHAVMDGAVTRLASAMDSEARASPRTGGDLDPLSAACRTVGRALGIEIVDPGQTSPDGVAADQLGRILRASRVRARRVALRDRWWKRDNGPLLAFVDSDSRPVALVAGSGSHFYDVVDPTHNTRRPVTPAVAETLSSFAYMLYRPFPAQALKAWEVLKFGFRANQIGDGLSVLATGVLIGLLALFTPIATGIIFDAIIPSGERRMLLQITLALVVMTVGTALFQLTRGIAMLRIETKMGASVQAGVWDRLLTLPPSFFRDYLAGDLASRSLGIDAIRRLLTGATMSSLLGGVFSIFSFGLLFYYSASLALVATGLVFVAAAMTVIAGVRQVRLKRALLHLEGRIGGLVLQLITGMSKLRVAGAEARAFAVWAKEFTEQRRLAFKARAVENGLQVFNAAFPVVASMCIFGALALSITVTSQGESGSLSTGSFLAFNAAFGQFVAASLQMSSVIVSLLHVVPMYERAKPILESVPEVDLAKASPGDLSGAIELSQVSFRYHADGPLVLDDISIQAKSGEFVAIVGPSGAGKSSVLRLLLGFEAPENGSVYYDGKDLATLDVQAVRRQTGVVLQNAQVLPGTIFENIVGSGLLTIDDAAEAAAMAGLAQDIERMPMGMHTVIIEGGGTLSGGQRQRLLIARAVVGKPRILLFDEATSALDNRTQAHVSASLAELHTTRVVVAHRLSTIVNADRIYVMDKGRVVQVGTYDELIDLDGLFAALARRQIA